MTTDKHCGNCRNIKVLFTLHGHHAHVACREADVGSKFSPECNQRCVCAHAGYGTKPDDCPGWEVFPPLPEEKE